LEENNKVAKSGTLKSEVSQLKFYSIDKISLLKHCQHIHQDEQVHFVQLHLKTRFYSGVRRLWAIRQLTTQFRQRASTIQYYLH